MGNKSIEKSHHHDHLLLIPMPKFMSRGEQEFKCDAPNCVTGLEHINMCISAYISLYICVSYLRREGALLAFWNNGTNCVPKTLSRLTFYEVLSYVRCVDVLVSCVTRVEKLELSTVLALWKTRDYV